MYDAATVAQRVACRIAESALVDKTTIRNEIVTAVPPPATELEAYVLEGLVARAQHETAVAIPICAETDMPTSLANRAAVILEKRYGERWTLARLARELATNRYELTRCFKAAFGTGVHAYLVRRRVIAIEERVAAGEKVEAAALSSGFASRQTFYDARRRLRRLSSC